MTNAIIAQLSSDSYATALNITVRSPAPVLALCRNQCLPWQITGARYGEAAELKMGVSPTGTPAFRPRQTMLGGPTIESE
jgi:hypothetical protein